MYSRILPATSMLARPLVSPAGLPQPVLGAVSSGPEPEVPPSPIMSMPAMPADPAAGVPLPDSPDPVQAASARPAMLTKAVVDELERRPWFIAVSLDAGDLSGPVAELVYGCQPPSTTVGSRMLAACDCEI